MRGGLLLNASPDTSIGEPEQDANSALTELDKGLRSSKVGEQCEAIVRFPRLFEKYPFPILINSSFLKLADVFRMGNNFLRLWVLRVCQQSEKHLDKILNVDEFLRRIFSVLHSNDSVARALALRTLGAVAGIIPERQNVHHAIRRGLDSHDNVEVDAAIYATTRFAAHSNAFAVAMCNKLSDMVESENTAAERRDKLVRALRTVHGGAVRAEGVLKLLQSLMEQYPSSSFVRSSIAAITDIAVDTVVHVPDQVEVLLHIAVADPRWSVRRAALLGLSRLATHAALWDPRAIQALVGAAAASPRPPHVVLCLQVMKTLVKCGAVCAAAGSLQPTSGSLPSDGLETTSLRQFCAGAAVSPSLKIASTAVTVLTDIVVHCYEEHLPVEGADLMLALESLVIATGQDGKDNTKPLKIALRCLVLLSDAEPLTYSSRAASLLGDQLSALPWRPPNNIARQRLEAILEALCGLAANTPSALNVRSALPALRGKMVAASEISMEVDSESSDENGTALVLLLTAVMQERAAAALTVRITSEWQHEAMAALSHADGWTKYRVARAALRYGHHDFAVSLISGLKDLAPSEATQRWLAACERAAKADGDLEKDGIAGLERASAAWELASEAASSSGNGGLASSWLSARAAALSALARTAAAARALCTQPPPAVAHAHSQTNREPTAKVGACAVALRKAARALQAAALKYADIARAAFHADDSTLEHLDIVEYTYSNLSALVLSIATGAAAPAPRPPPAPRRLELRRLTPKPHPIVPPNALTHKHAKAVLTAVSSLCAATVWPLAVFAGRGAEPLCRLALSPGARAAADHAPLPLSHRLALHVEGLITTKPPRKSSEKREVKGVQLTITATPHPRTNEKTVELTNIPPILTAVQTVTPVRDFFSAQQLISVSAAGLHTVAVDAAFVDQRGGLWRAGGATMTVKAHEDPASKSNTQTTRGRF